MKTLSIYLREKLVPFSGFVIPRSSMPQIQYLDHFLNYIDHLGITYKRSSGPASRFHPTQFEYDEQKVLRLKANLQNQVKPIIVSEDNFVLDGHHRYFAFHNEDLDINYIMIQLPINKLLKLGLDYTESYG